MYMSSATMLSLFTLLGFFTQIILSKPKKQHKYKSNPTLEELHKATKLLEDQSSTYSDIESALLSSNTRFKDFKLKFRKPYRKRNINKNKAGGKERFATAPNFRLRCRIFCKSGYLLQILPDGRVQGTTNQNDIFTYLELQSYGTSLLRIKGIYSMNYLSMTKNGKFKASKSPSLRNSLFKETHEENAYNSYSSYKYFYENAFDMMLGIRGNGQLKKTWKAYPGQTATQFLIIKEYM